MILLSARSAFAFLGLLVAPLVTPMGQLLFVFVSSMVPVSPPVEAILDPDSNGDSYGPLLYFTSLGFRLGTRPARVAA